MSFLFCYTNSYLIPQSLIRRFLPMDSRSASSLVMSLRPDVAHKYHLPPWAEGKLTNLPKHGRLHLANLPTPLHAIGTSGITSVSKNKKDGEKKEILNRLEELDIKLYIKRDDATGGAELGGNKVRKLEFLLAEALAEGCDSVVTIGGEQSNHCRATASASRMVGLSPHLILRTQRAEPIHDKKDDIGWTGNILFDRMVGSTIYTCTPGEYGRLGSQKLVEGVCKYLQRHEKASRNPYPIPVGGSNGVGSWGYINAVDELMEQLASINNGNSTKKEEKLTFDHVVFATGSGGTATGIALGMSLAYGSLGDGHPATKGQPAPKLHAVGVCDNPEYFYKTMTHLAQDMGLSVPLSTYIDENDTTSAVERFVRDSVTVHHGKGRGYALSTDEELDFITQFSLETGIVLDPVYSGKALYHFVTEVLGKDPESYRGSSILFWHTGGALGMYEKGNDLLGRLKHMSSVKRIDAYGTKGASDGSNIVQIIT